MQTSIHHVVRNPRQHRCLYCPKTFKRSEHRIRHQRTHTHEKPFSCRFCRKAYSRKYVSPATLGPWLRFHTNLRLHVEISPLDMRGPCMQGQPMPSMHRSIWLKTRAYPSPPWAHSISTNTIKTQPAALGRSYPPILLIQRLALRWYSALLFPFPLHLTFSMILKRLSSQVGWSPRHVLRQPATWLYQELSNGMLS